MQDVRRRVSTVVRRLAFHGSRDYWERRYARGGNSGAGSYGERARYKAAFLNAYVQSNDLQSVIELGCGDGNQLSMATYPRYIGLDVSPSAVRRCIERFGDDHSKSFFAMDPTAFMNNGALTADAALSLDVIFHLVEDAVFDAYMRNLFRMARRAVIIFSADDDTIYDAHYAHVRHRRFTAWIDQNMPGWKLTEQQQCPPEIESNAGFFVFTPTA